MMVILMAMDSDFVYDGDDDDNSDDDGEDDLMMMTKWAREGDDDGNDIAWRWYRRSPTPYQRERFTIRINNLNYQREKKRNELREQTS